MDSRDSLDRLRGLDPEAFARVVAALARAEWPGAVRVEVSPPSPERGVDAHVGRAESDPVLLHARQYEAHDDLGAEAVRDLTAFPGTALVATTGGITATALEAATAAGVELLDGREFLVQFRERGITLRDDPAEHAVEDTVDELAARWPSSLRETARDLAVAVDDVAAFERTVERADRSTDLVFVRDEPVTRLRFSEAGLLVYVRDDGWERVVAYPASGAGGPPVPAARERVVDAVRERL